MNWLIEGDVQCKNDKDSWDFGEGAGFYVDSTNPDYSHHYKMYSYVCEEFYNLIFMNFPIVLPLTNQRFQAN